MKRGLTKAEFEQWATSRGWTRDKYGHLRKTVGDKKYRFRTSSISVRYELKVHRPASMYSGSSSEWMRLRSGYFKDLGFDKEGKLTGLKL